MGKCKHWKDDGNSAIHELLSLPSQFRCPLCRETWKTNPHQLANGKIRRKPGPLKGDPRMVEAGKLGGAAVKKLGRGHFSSIGRKGGQALRDQYGPEHFEAIGRKGGETTYAARGKEGFAEMGKLGGTAPRKPKTKEERAKIARKTIETLGPDGCEDRTRKGWETRNDK